MICDLGLVLKYFDLDLTAKFNHIYLIHIIAVITLAKKKIPQLYQLGLYSIFFS